MLQVEATAGSQEAAATAREAEPWAPGLSVSLSPSLSAALSLVSGMGLVQRAGRQF